MNKGEFLANLRNALSGLPQADIDERINFYSEIIDDKMEEGLEETEAVSGLGTVEEITAQILAEIPLSKIVKERVKPKRTLNVWEIVLLVLGSPIWLSLLIAAFAVILSVYVVIWSLIISLWAIEVSLMACSLGSILAAVIFIYQGHSLIGAATFSAGLVCLGLSVFIFFACKAATKGFLILTKKLAICIKNCFIKKEAAR